jgi:hypothetical protein
MSVFLHVAVMRETDSAKGSACLKRGSVTTEQRTFFVVRSH